MTDSQRVAAVVVTYNRKALLPSCLEGILAQTKPVQRVFLIDNASTDGTKELLRSAGYLGHPLIAYVRLPENTGGAGGFHEGLRRASSEKFDWYWVLDDDVEPEPSTLEVQLRYRNISECIHPLVVYEDGSAHEWEHIVDPYTTHQIGLENWSFRNGKDWCAMHVACFEGMLISERMLEKVGLPDKDFFVSGDDGLFGFKASLFTNVIYIKDGKLLKKIKPTAESSPFKIYYDLRNRFLLRRKLAELIWTPKYSRYAFLCFMLFATVDLLKHSFSSENARAAVLAWYDGLRGVVGRHRY